jgi:hypothetical protein
VWPYQGSTEVVEKLHEGLVSRYTSWKTGKAPDKRNCPVFTVIGGPGSGKSRLLQEFPKLALAAIKSHSELHRLLVGAYIFHVSFENGTKFRSSEVDGAVALGNRMMWQLVRPRGASQSFEDFAATHRYSIGNVLSKLSELTGVSRLNQPVFLLVDGVNPQQLGSAPFRLVVEAMSSIVTSKQIVVGAIASILSSPITDIFGNAHQLRVMLQPPLLSCPAEVIPDDELIPQLAILRDDMGGYGRALEILSETLNYLRTKTRSSSLSTLSTAVQHKFQEVYNGWLESPGILHLLEPLLEAIISRKQFIARSEVVVATWTVDSVCSLGLVQWRGVGPLIAPVFLLLMLKDRLPLESTLRCLADGYDKLQGASDAGTWWQDFEIFVADFCAIKAKAFRSAGWVRFSEMHYGARLSTALQHLIVRIPPTASDIRVVTAVQQYSSKSSGAVRSVAVSNNGKKMISLARGDIVVRNGASAPFADIFCDVDVREGTSIRRRRETIACRHRTEHVSAASFDKEWHKAADQEDLFMFFASSQVLVDLEPLSAKKVGVQFTFCVSPSYIYFARVFFCITRRSQSQRHQRRNIPVPSLDVSTDRASRTTLGLVAVPSYFLAYAQKEPPESKVKGILLGSRVGHQS